MKMLRRDITVSVRHVFWLLNAIRVGSRMRRYYGEKMSIGVVTKHILESRRKHCMKSD